MNKLFGVHLRKAALIVGSLYVLIFVYGTIHASYNLANSFRVENETYHSDWGINTDTNWFRIFLVVLSAASLIASIFLILGSLRYNHYYLLTWLVDGAVIIVGLCLCLIYVFYIFVISVLYTKHSYPCIATGLLLATILVLALKIYLWLGIQQLYKDIREGISRRKSLPSTVPLYTQVDEFNKYAF